MPPFPFARSPFGQQNLLVSALTSTDCVVLLVAVEVAKEVGERKELPRAATCIVECGCSRTISARGVGAEFLLPSLAHRRTGCATARWSNTRWKTGKSMSGL